MNDQEEEMTEIVFAVRALLSLLLAQHVRSWYTGLTQDEEVFRAFSNLTSQIGNCLTGRVQSVDWSYVFNQDLPEIILRHLEDVNIARDRTRVDLTTEQAFRTLQDHSVIDDQDIYLMHVADALLIVLLPEEHLMSEVAYCFSRELLSDLILKTIIERLSEPWFWDEIMLKICHASKLLIAQRSNSWQLRLKTLWKSSTFQRGKAQSLTASTLRGPSAYVETMQGRQNTFIGSIFGRCRQFLTTLYTRPSIYDTSLPLILCELLRPTKWALLEPLISFVVLPVIDLIAGPRILDFMASRLELSISHSSLAKLITFARNVLFPNDLPSAPRSIPTLAQQAQLRTEVTESLPEGLAIPFYESKVINKIVVCKIMDCLIGKIFPELRKRSPEQLKEKVIRIRQANFEAAGSGGISTGRVHHSTVSPPSNESSKQETFDHSMNNLRKFESEQEGLSALEAMRRSFEVKRHTNVSSRTELV